MPVVIRARRSAVSSWRRACKPLPRYSPRRRSIDRPLSRSCCNCGTSPAAYSRSRPPCPPGAYAGPHGFARFHRAANNGTAVTARGSTTWSSWAAATPAPRRVRPLPAWERLHCWWRTRSRQWVRLRSRLPSPVSTHRVAMCFRGDVVQPVVRRHWQGAPDERDRCLGRTVRQDMRRVRRSLQGNGESNRTGRLLSM